MIPRGQLYISYKDILKGIYFCLNGPLQSDEQSFKTSSLICFSVRTGFDLALMAFNFPAGSEILMTDINIPDMFSIVSGHRLRAVPILINKRTLSMSATDLESAITPATKAILITHLFGGICDTTEIITFAKKHNLIVFEDCAQAYAGNLYKGNPESDVRMFSFGFIKTNTAISGALIQLRDPVIFEKVMKLNASYERQSTIKYLQKLLKVVFVKLLTNKPIYTGFYNWVISKGTDFDTVLSGFTKSFPGKDILSQIRYRPSIANERLLKIKLRDFKQNTINKRINLANSVLCNIPKHYKIGAENSLNTYWVIPIRSKNPTLLINYLRNNGFDASQKASSLIQIKSTQTIQNLETLILDELVYLPSYAKMSKRDCAKLSNLLIHYQGDI